ncbi:uncharacterized protein EI97DRAFT_389469 [Westerdykella ornata]|uniref:GDP/GTP exchange factor Sec2 N-terminal domain-containing protein n=1 Tax=Westerdykella ornata TaxID=318751 RepID=A0A6A6JXI0_WESOR|nr:uncharacterized protein EI97DRAFT_389469 [Westerdykella ornata]KAF2281117.1 hypothetical protein EI97DRAFT_389469 [Westerdykella ornata]
MAVSLVDEHPPAPTTYAGDPEKDIVAMAAHSCPKCGSELLPGRELEEARKKIKELEAQVEMLKEKATAAVDRCADYEDQLRTFRANNNHALLRTNTSDSLAPTAGRPSEEERRPSTAHSTSTKQSRFSFLTGRRVSPAQSTSHAPPTSPDPQPDTTLLEQQLSQERQLRAQAEAKAAKVDSEIEELSVQLFSQANEMVAAERKARAKLEARVEVLERRDREKHARLERLEDAVGRVERVKKLLAAGAGVHKKV